MGHDKSIEVAATQVPSTTIGTRDRSSGNESAGLPEVARTHYDIDHELARGGMGRILVACDRRIGRTVALKELLGDGDQLVRRFEREALVTGRLQHPAIVPVYEAGRWPSGEPFYAMKLVAGTPLDQVISDKPKFDDRLALLPTIIQIAEAIAYAHQERIIHRDLKPANVLVGSFGETVVIDWGLAKDLSATDEEEVAAGPFRSSAGDLTVAGSVMGTPMYMPPEQALGQQVDERADVYALGAILYHLLAGVAPYSGQTVEEVLAQVIGTAPAPIASRVLGVPDELVTIVEKAMRRDRNDRFRTAKELAEELVRFQAGKLVSAHRYSRWALARRFVRRHRAAVLAATLLILIGGSIGVVSIRQVVDARDDATAALARAESAQATAEAAERRAVSEREAAVRAQHKVERLLYAAALNTHSEATRTRKEWERGGQKDGEANKKFTDLYAEAISLYQEFIKDFPQSEYTYRFRYYLGEALFFSGRHIESVEHYIWVRDHSGTKARAKEDDLRVDAANSVISAYEAEIAKQSSAGTLKPLKAPTTAELLALSAPIKPETMPDLYARLQSEYDKYLQLAPDLRYAPIMGVNSALISLMHLQLDEALLRFVRVVKDYCHTPAATKARDAILVIHLTRNENAQVEAVKKDFADRGCGQ